MSEEEKVLKTIKNMLLHSESQLLDYEADALETILKLYEDKKEEAIAIARANYILGQTDERSQWYKKINEKIEDLQHNNNGDDYSLINVINIIKELTGKEE